MKSSIPDGLGPPCSLVLVIPEHRRSLSSSEAHEKSKAAVNDGTSLQSRSPPNMEGETRCLDSLLRALIRDHEKSYPGETATMVAVNVMRSTWFLRHAIANLQRNLGCSDVLCGLAVLTERRQYKVKFQRCSPPASNGDQIWDSQAIYCDLARDLAATRWLESIDATRTGGVGHHHEKASERHCRLYNMQMNLLHICCLSSLGDATTESDGLRCGLLQHELQVQGDTMNTIGDCALLLDTMYSVSLMPCIQSA